MDVTVRARVDVQKDFRMIQVRLHLPPKRNPNLKKEERNSSSERSVACARTILARQVTRVGLAEREALELVLKGLTITRDTDGQIVKADLIIPCRDDKMRIRALALLDPDRVSEEKKRAQGESKVLRQQAAPKFTNSYNLTEVRNGEDGTWLYFTLFQKYRYTTSKGQEREGIVRCNFLQRLITTYVRPSRFIDLDRRLRDGAAQEVAQMIESHLGLNEANCQPSVGRPDLLDCDPRSVSQHNDRAKKLAREIRTGTRSATLVPIREILPNRFTADDERGNKLVPSDKDIRAQLRPMKLKRQPLRFVNSADAVVYIRRWSEHGVSRHGLYVAIPVLDDEFTLGNGDWWKGRLGEFEPLPAWSDKKLLAKHNVVLIPLSLRPGRRLLRESNRSVRDVRLWLGQRFIKRLSDPTWKVCWSLIAEKPGRKKEKNGHRTPEYMLQLILSREVEVASRPNLLAVYPAVSATESGHETRLLCSLLKEGESEPENVGFVTVDHLPSNGSWPDRQNRKRLAYTAARSIVARARSANADIVIGEVSGIKKRGQGGAQNVLATRFIYSSLTKFINHKALDIEVPIRVWSVNSYLLKAVVGTDARVRQVAIEGKKIREKYMDK